MNSLRTQRRLRKSLPALENLDQRITPSAMPAAAALAAQLRVETRQVAHWEAALANSPTGAREQMLTSHINRTQGRMASQQARLSRIVATPFARMQASNLARAAAATMTQQSSVNQLSAAPSPIQNNQPPFHGIIVSPPVTIGFGFPSAITVPTTPPGGTTTGQSGGTTTTTSPTQASLPANVSATLGVIYNAYLQNGSSLPATLPSTDGANTVVTQGSNVGIQVHDGNPADFAALVSSLESAGMQITVSSAQAGTVVGLLPIAQLPAVAALPNAPSVTPEFQMIMH